MAKSIDSDARQRRKTENRAVEPLRPNNRLKRTAADSTERPFGILSEDERDRVLRYCVNVAFRFYTSKNGDW